MLSQATPLDSGPVLGYGAELYGMPVVESICIKLVGLNGFAGGKVFEKPAALLGEDSVCGFFCHY